MLTNQNLKFTILIVLLSILYDFQNTIQLPPYSNHQWRQADGYSIAVNYYEEGLDFFNPKIHLQTSIEGKAVGEFPIIYYLNACIWKITGKSFVTFRLINLLLVFWGLFALFKLALLLLNDFFFASLIPLLLFASPLFAFYANNYLVNLPAISFMFIAWQYTYHYYKENKNKHLFLSIFLFTLSILLRPIMLIGLLPLFIVYFLEKARFFKNKIFDNNGRILPLFLIPILVFAGWFFYSKHYNTINNSGYFLSTVRPIWNIENMHHYWSKFTTNLLPEFYHSSILALLFIVLLATIITIKSQAKQLISFVVILSIELVAYLLLWFNNLDVHDYYLIDLFLVVPPLLIAFFTYLKKEQSALFYSKKIKILLVVIFSFSVAYSAVKVRLKYSGEVAPTTYFLLSEDEINYWRWYHWDYNTKYKSIETITPYLRSLGIRREDKVISFYDQSPNVTLSLMDQKGFTNLYFSEMSLKERIKLFKTFGAKYILINDPSYYENSEISEFFTHKIGSYKNIDIFILQ